jgi:formate dehydrogenase major subunit
VARLYATSKGSMILWGMGVSQHVHGTDNARCLIALALMTGQIGRPGTGLHPLRGQNNVQGASDAGLIPMMYPRLPARRQPGGARPLRAAWGCHARRQAWPDRGRDHGRDQRRRVRGMYIMGENPAMSDPDANHAREALAALEHLVVQDIFLTETAYLADVILPASAFPEKTGTFTNTDRLVQLGRQAITRRATRSRTCGSSSRWRAAWACRGTTATCPRCSTRCAHHAQHRRHHLGAPGARGAVTYPCMNEGDPASRWCSSRTSRAKAAGRASCRPTSSRPPSVPMPSTRWC